MIFRKPFKITGVANHTQYADGITSTPKEKKRLLSMSVLINGYADNELQGWHEKAQVIGIPDRLLDVEADTFDTNLSKPGARINDIEIGLDIPEGESFKAALKCGATAKNVHGFYAYELIA